MLWVKRFLNEFGYNQDRNIVYCNSQSIIYLSKNASFHSKSKHIDVRFVRDMQITWVDKIHTDKNKQDMITKVMIGDKHLFYKGRGAWWELPTSARIATGVVKRLLVFSILYVPSQEQQETTTWCCGGKWIFWPKFCLFICITHLDIFSGYLCLI